MSYYVLYEIYMHAGKTKGGIWCKWLERRIEEIWFLYLWVYLIRFVHSSWLLKWVKKSEWAAHDGPILRNNFWKQRKGSFRNASHLLEPSDLSKMELELLKSAWLWIRIPKCSQHNISTASNRIYICSEAILGAGFICRRTNTLSLLTC